MIDGVVGMAGFFFTGFATSTDDSSSLSSSSSSEAATAGRFLPAAAGFFLATKASYDACSKDSAGNFDGMLSSASWTSDGTSDLGTPALNKPSD
jgi:hypothetical protein